MPDHAPAPSGFTGKRLSDRALWQLSRARMVGFLREPEAVFWTFAFPLLMALALGIAFRNQGPQRSRVGVEIGPGADSVSVALSRSKDIEVVRVPADETDAALRRGKIAVLVRAGQSPPRVVYDPSRPETRLAFLVTVDALERAAGRTDRVGVVSDTRARPGSRYIDFLIPGLIGLNLLGTGMWGVGFPIAGARQQKLLKRMIATPMRRRDYLWSLVLARAVWLLLEVATVLGFGVIAFGTYVRGSWLAFALVVVIGAFAFSALGLLVVSRARTIEAVSGLMNFVMMPMWLLSGSFFSSERFPAVMQPLVQALPLTLVNNGLRAIMNESAGLAGVAPQLIALGAWGVVCFALALRLFRWE
ncbi:MAG TPA: ABC transporter permease [Candidatus Sulfotelmatobacter sp.]|nr:ABC transporter permease [Candidatus Sulfotelmatobacter sp.]